ncbi:SciE type virulence protein [Oleomonas cavernae]|uniref:SciE type virulence protein n=1 Tax=Oleomonas cavernae TaxID=2320859 RepID=A0A418WE68_9PROT|nr:type VI secretion system accessory protein TagJ [Oleomonas cavernae]RJF88317.1 SciE type virulence protein [Oleomonas cavernae]
MANLRTAAQDAFDAGDIEAAVAAQVAIVKAKPAEVGERVFLSELLCFAGDYARADKQLDVLTTQEPKAAMPLALLRQIIRAEITRHEVWNAGRVPELLGEPPAHLSARLRALAEARAGDLAAAQATLAAAESPRVAGTHDDTPFEDWRDLDDILGGTLEVLTSTGKCYWVAIERVIRIEFHAPERARDLLFRRALLAVKDGPEGEVFIPTLYVPPKDAPATPAVRLGRASDWLGGDGTPVRGVGQRTFLIGDDAVAAMDLGVIELTQEAAA